MDINGFMSMLYSPKNINRSNPYWVGQQPVNPQDNYVYIPELVLTDLQIRINKYPGMLPLAIALAALPIDNGAWRYAFRPQRTERGEIDRCDVGALNIEANIFNEAGGCGRRIDTKSETFGLDELNMYLQSIASSEVVLSIDCPRAGPQSWYLEQLVDIAAGDQDTKSVFLKELDDLFSGAFFRNTGLPNPENIDIFVKNDILIHLGYWKDRYGHLRDIREIDLIAVANIIGEKQPLVIREWEDTFLQTNMSPDVRLSKREKMIQEFTDHTTTFTGYARRLTFTGTFMRALLNSLNSSGINIRISVPELVGIIGNNRPVADFAAQGMFGYQSGFAYGFGGGMNINPSVHWTR
jgi:hypothetical protein